MRCSTIHFWRLVVAVFLAGTAVPAAAAPRPKPTATPTSSVTPTKTPTSVPTPTRTPTPPPGAVSVTITDPVAGANVTSDRYTVRGTFTGPANTGVTVDDVVAYTTNGRFAINDVSLTAGTNTITAVATAPTGQSAMTAVDVTAAGTPAVLTLKADRTTGIVPLTVTFTYEFRSTLPINKLMMDFDGDGRDDLRTVKAPPSVQNTYTQPDLYTATLTITDSGGHTYKANLAVDARTAQASHSLFRSVLGPMNAALFRGAVNGALVYLNSRAQGPYSRIFNDLQSDMPAIIASYSAPQRVSIEANYLEYAINRMIDGENQVFF